MNPGKTSPEFPSPRRERLIDSSKAQAADAAWDGADVDRPISGEDPASESLAEARHWVAVYRHLVKLEQELFDRLAMVIPTMPPDAQREAEATNLPVMASHLERFRHRLDYWVRRQQDLEQR